MAVEQIQNENTVEIDGKLFDAETGELLRTLGKGPEWAPATPDDFEAIGQWLSGYDGELAGIEARRKFINENLDAMARVVQRRKDGLLWKFRPLIEAHAKANLPKGKKTWTCPFMSVAFRSVGPRIAVTDQETALGWAKNNAPESVELVEKFYVSRLPDRVKAELLANPESATGSGLEVTAPRETVDIRTS